MPRRSPVFWLSRVRQFQIGLIEFSRFDQPLPYRFRYRKQAFASAGDKASAVMSASALERPYSLFLSPRRQFRAREGFTFRLRQTGSRWFVRG
jgi:hypothetical protein